MPKMVSVLAVFMTAALSAGAAEFYRFDLSGGEPGTPWVSVDDAGKQTSVQPRWGMWPRNPGTVGARVVDTDGKKALEIQSNIQVNFAGWDLANPDTHQTVAYTRFVVRVPKTEHRGMFGSLRLQQVNNRTGAFVSLLREKNDERPRIVASNGDGKGKVMWKTVGTAEFDRWIVITVRQDFKDKTYSVTVDDQPAVDNLVFRHADAWEGSMWARDLASREQRFDFAADKDAVIQVAELVLSAEPIP